MSSYMCLSDVACERVQRHNVAQCFHSSSHKRFSSMKAYLLNKQRHTHGLRTMWIRSIWGWRSRHPCDSGTLTGCMGCHSRWGQCMLHSFNIYEQVQDQCPQTPTIQTGYIVPRYVQGFQLYARDCMSAIRMEHLNGCLQPTQGGWSSFPHNYKILTNTYDRAWRRIRQDCF